MIRIILTIIISFFIYQSGYSQDHSNSDELGLAFPIIWNETTILNTYSGAHAEYLKGSSLSYGINANYLRSVKSFFFSVGLGYYKQNFEITRPFDFNGDTITKLLYHTKNYLYNNISLNLGLGYMVELSNSISLQGSLTFNELYSFSQVYKPRFYSGSEHKKIQVETEFFSFGRMVNLNFGINRKIHGKYSICTDLVIPVLTRWRKDSVFREPTSEFYHSDFTLGLNICFRYMIHQ